MLRNPVLGGMAQGRGGMNPAMNYGKMHYGKGGQSKGHMGGAIPTKAIKALRTTGTYKARGICW